LAETLYARGLIVKTETNQFVADPHVRDTLVKLIAFVTKAARR
jgi:hypothetical protein